MTLGAYFAAAAEHQQLAWMGGSTLEILVDSAVSNGQVLIMRSNTTRGDPGTPPDSPGDNPMSRSLR